MLRVITQLECLFIIETLQECADSDTNVEEACHECIEILQSLDSIREEDYE